MPRVKSGCLSSRARRPVRRHRARPSRRAARDSSHRRGLPGIRDWTADRDSLPGNTKLGGRVDGRFGRPIDVEDRPARPRTNARRARDGQTSPLTTSWRNVGTSSVIVDSIVGRSRNRSPRRATEVARDRCRSEACPSRRRRERRRSKTPSRSPRPSRRSRAKSPENSVGRRRRADRVERLDEMIGVAMLRHHALRASGGPRGVDHVAQIGRAPPRIGPGQPGRRQRGDVRRAPVQGDDLAVENRLDPIEKRLLGDQQRNLGLFDDVADAFVGMGRVDRRIGGARLEAARIAMIGSSERLRQSPISSPGPAPAARRRCASWFALASSSA